MSGERESKYRNEKKFPFLDCAMATELMSTNLPFAFRFVSFRSRCFVILKSLLVTFQVTFSSYESNDKGNRKLPDRPSYVRVFSDIFGYLENPN